MPANADVFQFMSIEILAGPGVLIPRAETELLGRTALKLLSEGGLTPLVIDMCCGSGNLGLAIADARADARVLLSDLTDETTRQARTNAERLRFDDRVTIGQGDMFAGIAAALAGARADLIVCNPPISRRPSWPGTVPICWKKSPARPLMPAPMALRSTSG